MKLYNANHADTLILLPCLINTRAPPGRTICPLVGPRPLRPSSSSIMVGSGTPGEPEADGVEIRAGLGGPRAAAAIASQLRLGASWHVRDGCSPAGCASVRSGMHPLIECVPHSWANDGLFCSTCTVLTPTFLFHICYYTDCRGGDLMPTPLSSLLPSSSADSDACSPSQGPRSPCPVTHSFLFISII